jgi:hypothetical protein
MIVRQLEPSEWVKVLDAGVEPFTTYGLPDPEHWILVGAFDDDRLVAVTGIYETVHNDPWWIDPTYRRNPALVGALWDGIRKVLTARGVDTMHVVVADDLPEVQAMVMRLGYHEAPGRLYIVHIPDAVLSRR